MKQTMFSQKSNVLVVAAHPDDEVLGCGATIAKHTSCGERVRVLILGEGIAARKSLSLFQKRKQVKFLHSSARRANRMLGVEKITIKSFSDNQLDTVPLLEIIQDIEEEINEFKPVVIYTHHFGDVNVDHRLTQEAISAAVRPMADSCVRQVLSFEVPSSTEWAFHSANMFRPNIYVDVSRTFEMKLKALSEYASELRTFPHPRSLEYVRALAQVRGGNVGYEKAEAFELMYQRID